MDCKKMAKKLQEFLDHDLSDDELHTFQAHLAACEPCFTRIEFEKILRLTVKKGLTTEMPAGLKHRITDAIRAAAKEEHAK